MSKGQKALPAVYGIAGYRSVMQGEGLAVQLEQAEQVDDLRRRKIKSRTAGRKAAQWRAPDVAELKRQLAELDARRKREVAEERTIRDHYIAQAARRLTVGLLCGEFHSVPDGGPGEARFFMAQGRSSADRNPLHGDEYLAIATKAAEQLLRQELNKR